jgi:hypothetical protein
LDGRRLGLYDGLLGLLFVNNYRSGSSTIVVVAVVACRSGRSSRCGRGIGILLLVS